ncbi:hypothetical protein Afil01_64000 [Actinorhabdospora filicis]|uniref:DUF4132 domain-containing protein n=1 Tax=Actinorhabdospora filicis TaxID=1785913 RepID=A0A9W6WCZ5_9ACTN|nr:DUF4132 domain-containing protein [Actinorhabdospora filicis]GLZ81593.1 hypothetical protein Afil01_64000 [Actinorhabdospora filicis]
MIDSLPSWVPTAEDAWSARLRDLLADGVIPGIDALGAHLATLDQQRTARGAVKKAWEKTTAKLMGSDTRPFVFDMVLALTGEPLSHDTSNWRDMGLTAAGSRSLAKAFVLASGYSGEGSFAAHLEHLARYAAALRGMGARYRDDAIAEVAFRALETLGTEEAFAALCHLRRDIDYVILREHVEPHLLAVATALGVPDVVREERSVPAHALNAQGVAIFGGEDATVYGNSGLRADLEVDRNMLVGLTWYDADGLPDYTTYPFPSPRGHKRVFRPENIEGVQRFAKRVHAEVAAQRARLRDIPAGRTWDFAEWAEHYRDHHLVGVLTASLIWEHRHGEDWTAALAAEVPDTAEEIRLWTDGKPGEAEALRERLGSGRRQAFAQLPG